MITITQEEVADWLAKEVISFPQSRKEVLDSVYDLFKSPSDRTILMQQLAALNVYLTDDKSGPKCAEVEKVADACTVVMSGFAMLVLITKKVEEARAKANE